LQQRSERIFILFPLLYYHLRIDILTRFTWLIHQRLFFQLFTPEPTKDIVYIIYAILSKLAGMLLIIPI
jgi:hypothetical protein